MTALLVSYDIPDDKRRRKVARALVRIGRRVQFSVFVVHRGTALEVERVLSPLIDPSADNVRIHPLCASCEARSLLMGRAEGAGEGEDYSVF